MAFIPRPHEIYRHFKGNLYQVTALAEHTETGEQLVVYQALYGDFKSYARPLAMFVERIDREKYPGAEQEFRFELQGSEAARQREESEPEARERLLEPGSSVHPEAVSASGSGEHAGTVSAQGGGVGPDTVSAPGGEAEVSEEYFIDPLVLEFLDSDSYEQRLNILAGLHHRITKEMITTMAIACDVEINDGDVEEQYEALRGCLLTLERYECNRLR